MADALNIRLGNTGAERGAIRVLGGHWPVQFEVVQAELVAHPETSWSVRAAFVTDPALQMPFQGVLGTEGFLDKFVVTFNKYYDYFMVERPDDWEQRVGCTFDDPATAADPQWERPSGV